MNKQELNKLLDGLELINEALSDAKECTGAGVINELLKCNAPKQTINKIERANTGAALAKKLLAAHVLKLLTYTKS